MRVRPQLEPDLADVQLAERARAPGRRLPVRLREPQAASPPPGAAELPRPPRCLKPEGVVARDPRWNMAAGLPAELVESEDVRLAVSTWASNCCGVLFVLSVMLTRSEMRMTVADDKRDQATAPLPAETTDD